MKTPARFSCSAKGVHQGCIDLLRVAGEAELAGFESDAAAHALDGISGRLQPMDGVVVSTLLEVDPAALVKGRPTSRAPPT